MQLAFDFEKPRPAPQRWGGLDEVLYGGPRPPYLEAWAIRRYRIAGYNMQKVSGGALALPALKKFMRRPNMFGWVAATVFKQGGNDE